MSRNKRSKTITTEPDDPTTNFGEYQEPTLQAEGYVPEQMSILPEPVPQGWDAVETLSDSPFPPTENFYDDPNNIIEYRAELHDSGMEPDQIDAQVEAERSMNETTDVLLDLMNEFPEDCAIFPKDGDDEELENTEDDVLIEMSEKLTEEPVVASKPIADAPVSKPQKLGVFLTTDRVTILKPQAKGPSHKSASAARFNHYVDGGTVQDFLNEVRWNLGNDEVKKCKADLYWDIGATSGRKENFIAVERWNDETEQWDVVTETGVVQDTPSGAKRHQNGAAPT